MSSTHVTALGGDVGMKLCECGCGRPAPIARKSDSSTGRVLGQPQRFVKGHNAWNRIDLWERIRANCVEDDGCLVWQGYTTPDGYGRIQLEHRARFVHCVVYEYFSGPVPAGLHIDHVKARGCHSRACCNPAHLEPVTPRENTMRGESFAAKNAAKTRCPRGHELAGSNLAVSPSRVSRGYRLCRICRNIRERAARAARNSGEATA